jgi:hypothetical protein
VTSAERAARERKQKIFVIVGGLFLVALLAIQVPRVLGSSSEPQADSSEAIEAVTPGGTAISGRTRVAASQGQGLQTAKLSSFSLFKVRDPFVQQVKVNASDTASTKSAPAGNRAGDSVAPKARTREFVVGEQPAPVLTVISVNGARQALSSGTRFPAADPVFVLVAEQATTKSVTIGVVGGAYSSGSRTTKLVVGKPLVLMNTATGARYKLVLIAVGNGQSTSTSGENAEGTHAPTSDSAPDSRLP